MKVLGKRKCWWEFLSKSLQPGRYYLALSFGRRFGCVKANSKKGCWFNTLATVKSFRFADWTIQDAWQTSSNVWNVLRESLSLAFTRDSLVSSSRVDDKSTGYQVQATGLLVKQRGVRPKVIARNDSRGSLVEVLEVCHRSHNKTLVLNHPELAKRFVWTPH